MKRIEGERVTLRPIAPADRAPLKAIRDEPEVIRFWGRQTPEWPGDDESVAAPFDQRRDDFAAIQGSLPALSHSHLLQSLKPMRR